MAADDELRDWLAAAPQSYGTVGTDLFAGRLPAGVVNGTVLVMYPGKAPEFVCGGLTLIIPRLQVRVRNTDDATAISKAEQLVLLLGAIVNQTIGGKYYRSVMPLQSAGLLFQDKNDVANYGFNIEVEREK